MNKHICCNKCQALKKAHHVSSQSLGRALGYVLMSLEPRFKLPKSPKFPASKPEAKVPQCKQHTQNLEQKPQTQAETRAGAIKPPICLGWEEENSS